MPRQSKTTETVLPAQTLIIDNGAYTMKAGFASATPRSDDCHVIPNCIARGRDKRIWIGAQLQNCKDFGDMAFRRPIEKGFLVNWEAEKEIWESSFLDKGAALKCEPHETSLILTEAPNCPAALQANCDQMVFEEFEFAAYSRCIGPSFNAYNDIPRLFEDPVKAPSVGVMPVECLLVIDSGYSHTTVTPSYRGRPIHQATLRLDVGGKLLTNVLKELVSIRHYNMLDETYIMNEVKEVASFVSDEFKRDLEKTWRGNSRSRKKQDDSIAIDYILPDYNSHKPGFVRPHDPSAAAKHSRMGGLANPGKAVEDYMTLRNERFTVPELVFNPTDIGIKQSGLPETVMQSLSGLPPGLWPVMLANILVVGGNSKIEGFVERLKTEIRQLAPAECASHQVDLAGRSKFSMRPSYVEADFSLAAGVSRARKWMVSEGLFRSDREIDASSTTVEETVIDSSKRAAQ